MTGALVRTVGQPFRTSLDGYQCQGTRQDGDRSDLGFALAGHGFLGAGALSAAPSNDGQIEVAVLVYDQLFDFREHLFECLEIEAGVH